MIECKKVVANELGFINNGTGKHQSNTVFGTDGIAPTVTTVLKGGTQQIKIVDQQIVAMRGRNPENPSARSAGIELEQRLEPNEQGICNSLTTVQKDNLVLEKEYIDVCLDIKNPDFYNFLYKINGEIYLIRIRKLVPKECWRLMSFSDEDFNKAEKVNSNTQLYKQAGNSIVVKVLEAIFRQMMSDESEV